jgi:hypothetical protein
MIFITSSLLDQVQIGQCQREIDNTIIVRDFGGKSTQTIPFCFAQKPTGHQ